MLDKAAVGKIDFSKSNLYTLSIRLSADGFSFFIHDPFSASGLHYFTYPIDSSVPFLANVREMLMGDVFRHVYKRVNVVYADSRFTCVPNGFGAGEEDSFRAFFHYNHKAKENDLVLCNEWGKGNLKILFAVDRFVWDLLSRFNPDVHAYSPAYLLLAYFGNKASWGNTRKMFACMEDGFLYVFCFERGHFLFANSFAVQDASDAAYYLLYAWKQQGYAQERDELHVTESLVSLSGNLLDELRTFVHHVFVMNPDSEFCRLFAGDAAAIPFDLQSVLLFDFK